jgi:hypothetical protein
MAAGLGFKDFTTGEVLTAADVDGYLMQGVWVFASAAARDAAVTSPQEGNFAYLKDTNVTTYYTGSAWANLDTTGMTNPMTTTGDTIYSSSGSTPARLGIGTTGQVLTVAGGVPSWATPAGGASGLTFISRTTFSNVATVDIDPPFDNTYETYLMIIENISCATAADDVLIRGRYSTTVYSGADYYAANAYIKFSSTAWTWANSNTTTSFTLMPEADAAFPGQAAIYFANVGDASKLMSIYGNWSTRSGMQGGYIAGEINSAQTWTGIRLLSSSTNITGDVSFYGLAKA